MDNENHAMSEAMRQVSQGPVQNQSPVTASPYSYQPKPLFELAKGDNAFAICAVLVSVFTAIFGIFGGFALGYLISVVLMIALFAVYFSKGGKAGVLPVLCGLLSLANGAVFICTTNGSVRFFGVVVSFLLALVCFDGLRNGAVKGTRRTLGVFYSAASTMGNIGLSLRSLFNGSRKSKTVRKALIGVLCAIPVLIVVVPLLLSSDYAFSGMMSILFGTAFETIIKTVFGLALSLFVISYGLTLKKGRESRVKQGGFAGIEHIYIISFLSAIGVCYLLYLFSQFAYFFSAFRGFLPDEEITYAQYARKGFFEMCVIALINLAIVFLALFLSKKRKGRMCHGVKALTTFISVFTLIIISTAISKMVLYIDAYGMTILRLTTSAFMLFLAIVFISVILRIYILKINIVKTALLSAGIIVLALGAVNVNAVCAAYNYESYMSGRLDSIDIEELSNLGDEGLPYMVKLACSEKKGIARDAGIYLAEACRYRYFDDLEELERFTVDELKKHQTGTGFARFSIPKARAYASLYGFIESNPGFADVYRDYVQVFQGTGTYD